MFENKKGFTLIELIVVIAIISILVGLATPMFLGYTADAKLKTILNDIAIMENATDLYFMNHDRFPVLSQAVKEEGEVAINKKGDEITDLTGFNFIDKKGVGGTFTPSSSGQFALNEDTGEVVYIGKLKYKADQETGSLTENGITIDKEGNITAFVPPNDEQQKVVTIPDAIGGIEVKKYSINLLNVVYNNSNQNFEITFDAPIQEEGTIKISGSSVGSLANVGIMNDAGSSLESINPNNPNQFIYDYGDNFKTFTGGMNGVVDYRYWLMQGDTFAKQYKFFYFESVDNNINIWRDISDEVVIGDYKYDDYTKKMTIKLSRPLTTNERNDISMSFWGNDNSYTTIATDKILKINETTYEVALTNLHPERYEFLMSLHGEYRYSIVWGGFRKTGASTSTAPTEAIMEFNPTNNTVTATFTGGIISEEELEEYHLLIATEKYSSSDSIKNRTLTSPTTIVYDLNSYNNGVYFISLISDSKQFVNYQEIEITNSTAKGRPTSATAVYDGSIDKIVVTFIGGEVQEQNRSDYSLEIKEGEDYWGLSREWINKTTMHFDMRHESVGNHIIRLMDYSKGNDILINDMSITKVITMPEGMPTSVTYEYEEVNQRVIFTFDSDFPSNQVNDLTLFIGLQGGSTRSGYGLVRMDSNKVRFTTDNIVVNGVYDFDLKLDTTDTNYISGSITVTNGQFELNEIPNAIISTVYDSGNEELIVTFNKNIPNGFNQIYARIRNNGQQNFKLEKINGNQAIFKVREGQPTIPLGQVNEVNIRIEGFLSKNINVTF